MHPEMVGRYCVLLAAAGFIVYLHRRDLLYAENKGASTIVEVTKGKDFFRATLNPCMAAHYTVGCIYLKGKFTLIYLQKCF